MFILTISDLARPYFASNSSAKMASSNVFEHSRPMLNTNGLETLPALRSHIVGGDDRLAAHADEGQPAEPLLLGLAEGQRVGAVGVAAAGRGEDLGAVVDEHRLGLPGVVVLDARDHRRVDVVVLEQPDRASPTRTRRPGRAGVASRRRPGSAAAAARSRPSRRARAPDRTGGGRRRLPRPEPRTRPRARRAALDPVDAVAGAELVLEVEREVLALGVFVADDVVRTGDDAAGTARAQAGRDDLLEELLPLRRPAAVGTWPGLATSVARLPGARLGRTARRRPKRVSVAAAAGRWPGMVGSITGRSEPSVHRPQCRRCS